MPWLRIGLGVLAALQLALGVWAQWFPINFYTRVPTVAATPPYSEHLLRDFGGAAAAMGVVLGAATVVLERRLVVVALASYLVFSVPHTVFHLGHLQAVPLQLAVPLVGVLAATVVLPVALLLAVNRLPDTRPSPNKAPGSA